MSYGKHHPPPIQAFPFDTGVDASRLSKYTVFEAPDPVLWCPRGYAIIVTDPRGCWNSEGEDASFQTPVEGADEYDLIEWAAKLECCTGDIGLSRVSYLVQSQWMVAQMRPPSLKAIVAWEGWCDGTTTKPTAKASLKYDSESDDRLKFNFKFNKETAMVGYSKLRLAIQTPDNDDADIFVALRKLDDEGEQVTFTYFTVYEHGPFAQGCLRASHRALDEKRSKDYQPWRNHDKLEPLDPKKVYEIDIEFLAATARFLPCESLQIVIGGTDITKCKPSLVQKHG